MSIDTYPSPDFSTASAVLGYAEVTANQAGITTEVDLVGLAVTVTVPAGRRIRITGFSLFSRTVGDGTVTLRIREGATQIHQSDEASYGTDAATAQVVAIVMPTAGTHTYKLTMQRPTGSGTVSAVASSTYPAYILVEDISGGTGGPGPIFLGKVENFASAQSINSGTAVDITGAVLSVTVPAGRTIRLRGKIHVSATGAAGMRARLLIQEGGTVLDGAYMVISGANFGEEMEAVAYVNPTPGVHTYKLTLSRDNGSTALVIYSTAGDAMTSLVAEDITGTEAPTGAYYEAQWTPVTAFTNSWVNYGATYTPAAYRKVNDLVYLRGLIKNGTVSTPAFNLPVGYRPAWDHHFTGLSNSALAGIRVFQDGRVTPGDPGANVWIALDGIVFGVT